MEITEKPVTEKCPHCGAGMKAFWHTLTPGLTNILIEAIQFVHGKNENKFHLQKDLHLTVNQFSNFTKLRFHGLVAHYEAKAKKSGYWLITTRGGEFLRGEIAVPARVKTFRNHVIDHDTGLVKIGDFKGKITEFEKEFAYEYQRVTVAIPQDRNKLF